ncbi:two-component sensor histidine kinase [Calothrix sp. NIES-2100]|uniref:PAS domain S-box protein n=1 Tax=Calothrix sp. NIES-2100 TaxID=1954172 RepID=UPI000B5F2DE2|nr:two-component sensor histidine kinase [Calothrix sp. NIES-2100]
MMRNYPRLFSYGLAIGSTAIALLLRLWLESLLSETVGGCFYIAILITTWYGGYHAGLVSLVLSAVAIKYFFFYPRYQFWVFQPQSLFQLFIFLVVGLIINRLTSSFLNSKLKIQQLSQKLAQENAEQLRMALTGANMGMWDWNILNGEVKWSPETEQLFGLAIGTYDGTYETFDACLHPEDRQGLTQAVQQALQTHTIYQHEYRIIWADGSIHWLEGRGQGFYNAAGEPVRMAGTVMAIDDRKQAQITLEQQFAQQRLVMDMTVRIRRSLNLQDILQTTVDEVRQFLLCDRVTIFQFSPDWSGTIVVESVGANWTAILSAQISDPCFGEKYVEAFKAGLVTAKSDIYIAGIDSCHVQLLANFQVRANLVVPILHREELWGLLIAHHCEAPREWQTAEIELLRQLATQVSIAIQQADLYAQVQTELTERKQIEAALRHSEQRYRSLVHASAQIVWLTDGDGMTTVVPEIWEELSGTSTAQSLGLGWLDFVHPDDRDRALSTWQESYTNRTLYETEYRLRMKDGNYRDFAVRAVPILAADGEISEWIGTCTDITERKQAEAALRESQIQLQRQLAEIETIYQSAPIGLNVLDTELRFVRINQRLAEINGFSVQEHIGRTVRELLPDLADVAEPLLNSIIETGKPLLNVEITGETPAQPGVQRIWLESFLPLKDGERIIGISTVCEEITERKQAEQTLAKQALRIKTLFHTSFDGIVILDLSGNVIEANARFAEMLGYTLAETAKLSVFDWDAQFSPEELRQLISDYISFHSGVLETRHRRKDGSIYDVEISTSVVEWEGEIMRFCVCRDISERKQAEIALQQLNAELEQRVAERTAELADVNDRLLDKVIEQQQTQIILLEQSQLLDLAHDTIMTLDLQRRITFWNEGAENMYGFPKTEALGQISDILLQTQFPQPIAEIEAELLEKSYWEGEVTHFSRDNQPLTVASRWVLQKDNAGKPIKILEINNDITERKQAEFALSQSEERRRLALDLTHTAFWDWYLPSTDMVWNDNHFTLLGLAPYSIEPSYELWRNAIHPEDIDLVEQQFLESIETHSDYASEYRVIYPDGSVHWLMGRGRAIYDESGQPLRSLGVLLDISDRKLAEAILRQYERIVSSTKDGIALVNSNYIYQIVNQAYLDWCNKPDSEVLGKSKREVLGEKLFDSVIQSRLNRCLAGETIQYEQWFNYPNQVPQFISVTYTPYREPDGRISGVIVSMRDLTQLKQAQQMLELQAVITRNMAEGICLVRADNGIIVYANPKFEQMFGYDPGELNSQHVSIVNYGNESVNPEDVDQAIRSTVLQQGEATYEVHNVKKDGTPFWCSATCSVFNHPDYGDVLVAVHQDITDRKNIEDALRHSEEKFRQLADNIQAVFWMTDLQTQQVIYVSKAYETIWQSRCERVYQNFADWLDAIHPEDRRLVDLAFSEQLKTGYSDTKYRIIRPDGLIRWIRDRAFPIKNETGEITRIAGIAEDITELQKVEQIKSEFIGIVSHELRTPLTAIRAALGLLNSGIYDNRPEKSKRMIEIAATDCDRLVRLVNDILDLERLESGRAILDKTTCEAADLIQQAVEGVKAIAKQQNISFNIDITDAQVWADADAIIQTLTNLLSNALKFSPSDSTITLSVQPQTDCVLFQISDQGRGIPTEKLEVIFGRFQQVDASDSRDKGGTGLGLAICHSIVDQHNGKIWAESTLGVGSTFFFTLPLSGR